MIIVLMFSFVNSFLKIFDTYEYSVVKKDEIIKSPVGKAENLQFQRG